MKPLTGTARAKLDRLSEKQPERLAEVIAILRERGYDLSNYEPPSTHFNNFTTGVSEGFSGDREETAGDGILRTLGRTVGGSVTGPLGPLNAASLAVQDNFPDVGEEIRSFKRGVPEGASYNLSGFLPGQDTDPEPGAYTTEIPILGKVQPSREAGRILGGAFSGSLLANAGLKIVGIPLSSAVTRLLGKYSAVDEWAVKAIANVVKYSTGGTPEAVVASTADGIRAKDGQGMETFLSSLPLWIVLGGTSEFASERFGRFLKRVGKKKVSEFTPDEVAEARSLQDDIQKEMQDLRESDLKEMTEALDITVGGLNSRPLFSSFKDFNVNAAGSVSDGSYQVPMNSSFKTTQRNRPQPSGGGGNEPVPLNSTFHGDTDRLYPSNEVNIDFQKDQGLPIKKNAEVRLASARESLDDAARMDNLSAPEDVRLEKATRELDRAIHDNRGLSRALEDQDRPVAAAHVKVYEEMTLPDVEAHRPTKEVVYTEQGPKDIAPVEDGADFTFRLGVKRVMGVYSDLKSKTGKTLTASFREGKMHLNRTKLAEDFKNKVWTNPKAAGVTPLARDAFTTIDEWQEYVLSLAYYTKALKQSPGEAADVFQNRIVQRALRGRRIHADEPKPSVHDEVDEVVEQSPGAFDESLDNKLAVDDTPDVPSKPGDLVSITNGRQTIRGILEEGADNVYRIRSDRGGSVKNYSPNKWKIKQLAPPAQGGAPLPGEDAVASPQQRAQLASLFSDLRRHAPDQHIDPNKLIPDNLTQADARRMIQDLEDGLAYEKVLETERQVADIERETAAGTTSVPEDGVPPAHPFVDEFTVEELAVEPGLLYQAGVGSPISPHTGLAKNKLMRKVTEHTIEQIEGGQGKLNTWRNKYSDIRRLLGMPEWNSLTGFVRGAGEEIQHRIKGTNSPHEMARQRIHRFAWWVNAGGPAPEEFANNAQAQQAYKLWQELMGEVAEALGLAKGRQLPHYMTHVFLGRSGRFRAAQIGQQMGHDESRILQEAVGDLNKGAGMNEDPYAKQRSVSELADALNDGDAEVEKKGLRYLLQRSLNLEGHEYDLDLIANIYLRAAADKITTDSIVEMGQGALAALPEGPRKYLASYLAHAIGKPTTARVKIATRFQNWQLFNRSIDNLVELVGGAEEKGILQMARDGDPAEAINFLTNLDKMARHRNKVTGEPTGNFSNDPLGTVRAKTSLYIEDLRRALTDPNLSGPVANSIYRVQILSKLGLNFGHALINTTQYITNTWPVLNTKYSANGLQHYMQSGRGVKIHGKNADDLLVESGVALDASKIEEFIELNPGNLMKGLQDGMLAPSRWSEKVLRGSTLLGAYEKFMDEGMGHAVAISKAQGIVQKTQHPFNRGGTPPILRGPMGRLFFMFKSYPIHQTTFTYGLIHDAVTKGEMGPLVRHVMAYATLLGGGLTVLEGTNFAERTSPPVAEMMMDAQEGMGRRGLAGTIANTASGPFGDTLGSVADFSAHLLMFQGGEALDAAGMALTRFAEPTIARRFREDGLRVFGNPMRLLGFEKPKKKKKVRGGLEPLKL
jgi:hypothetical protein